MTPRWIAMAAIAPAAAATTKLGTLHRKSSCHTCQMGCRFDRAITPAIRPVLTKKYVAMAPTSGFGSVSKSSGPVAPPSEMYANPAAIIVSASAAMLNTVRYQGDGSLTLNVHCVHAPATAMRTAGCGPSSTSDMSSAACETDKVDPLATEIGRLTFHVDLRHDAA